MSFTHYGLAAAMLLIASVASAQPSISAADWAAYRDKFVETSGRVIDDGNGGISHSEGQGYGMLLAVLADNRADFEQIWTFTRTQLLLRDDGLAVWKWDPDTEPHVTDTNNATDGDILIAYALARAGRMWSRQDLTGAASSIANAVGKATISKHEGRAILLPAATGFAAGDRQDGPVVNLSYLVFEAFPDLLELAPGYAWDAVARDGLEMISRSRFGERQLPPDWLSLQTRPEPANGFAPEFGYNALRIPLYLARAGSGDPALLASLQAGMQNAEGNVELVNVTSGAVEKVLSDPGYRAIPALVACVMQDKPLPAELRRFTPTLYYPSTLHLLVLSLAAERHQACLSD